MSATESTPMPRSRHERPDPNVCPSCGAEGRLRELAKRYTWQPVTLDYDEQTGMLIEIDYQEFQTADDAEVVGVECGECGVEWASLTELGADQRLLKALQDHADHWRTRAERIESLSGKYLDRWTERLGYAEGAAEAYERAIAILRGNGEA
jgi:hypothetical protein